MDGLGGVLGAAENTKCAVKVGRLNPGGVVRVSRDFGRGWTLSECENDEAGSTFDAELQHASKATISDVTMSGSKLAFFTAHVAVVDYPRVNVSSCTF